MPKKSSSFVRVRCLDRAKVLQELMDLSASLEGPIQRVVLFGSLARGDHGARSDADILVIVADDPRPPTDRLAPFIRHFARASVPVDVLVWTVAEWERRIASGDRFARRIAGEGVTLWPGPG